MTMTNTTSAIVPTFDDDDENSGRKLAIICSKGNLDMAYRAGACEGRPGRRSRR